MNSGVRDPERITEWQLRMAITDSRDEDLTKDYKRASVRAERYSLGQSQPDNDKVNISQIVASYH